MKKSTKAILAVLSANGISFTATFATACGGSNGNNGGTNTDINQTTDGNETNDDDKTSSLTLAEFVQQYPDKAKSFIQTYIKENIVGNRELVSENWSLAVNSENKIDQIKAVVTSKNDDSRTITHVTASLVNPVALQDIVDGTVNENDIITFINRDNVLTFDVSENVNTSLRSAVISAINASGVDTISSDDKVVFAEATSNISNQDALDVAVYHSDGSVDLFNIYYSTATTDDEMIENLANNPNVYLEKSFALDENVISVQNYAYETTSTPSVDPDTPSQDENDENEISDLDSAILEQLDNIMLSKMMSKKYGKSYDSAKLKSYNWVIDEGDTINNIKLAYRYASNTENYESYIVLNATLSSPIDKTALTESNIEFLFTSASNNCSIIVDYSVEYSTTSQDTATTNLMNAIFEAYGMSKECPAGAERYFNDLGDSVDSVLGSEVGIYQVIEISDKKMTTLRINIKGSSLTAEESTTKLSDSSNYRFTKPTEYELTGKQLSKQASSTTEHSLQVNIIYDDEDEIEL